MWGTLRPFDESKRPTTPGIKPRPFTAQINVTQNHLGQEKRKIRNMTCVSAQEKKGTMEHSILER